MFTVPVFSGQASCGGEPVDETKHEARRRLDFHHEAEGTKVSWFFNYTIVTIFVWILEIFLC